MCNTNRYIEMNMSSTPEMCIECQLVIQYIDHVYGLRTGIKYIGCIHGFSKLNKYID